MTTPDDAVHGPRGRAPHGLHEILWARPTRAPGPPRDFTLPIALCVVVVAACPLLPLAEHAVRARARLNLAGASLQDRVMAPLPAIARLLLDAPHPGVAACAASGAAMRSNSAMARRRKAFSPAPRTALFPATLRHKRAAPRRLGVDLAIADGLIPLILALGPFRPVREFAVVPIRLALVQDVLFRHHLRPTAWLPALIGSHRNLSVAEAEANAAAATPKYQSSQVPHTQSEGTHLPPSAGHRSCPTARRSRRIRGLAGHTSPGFFEGVGMDPHEELLVCEPLGRRSHEDDGSGEEW
eukprot:CAMPEP_0180795518 /NCGR_PEP_ID=MMETSP1038_2-20121128/56252_1 /TAXON_ID=632150 /ORGANISM="Azadinium spinosum, Strain 3D9" /LENGTH=296 /DNA_ID=CAMNT_0022834463 /DNA_START=176 /DNA_END=1069 /DNA_ORIENTATION=+